MSIARRQTEWLCSNCGSSRIVGTAQCRAREEAGTTYWGQGVRKGALGPAMLQMFLYFLVVSICWFTNPKKFFNSAWTCSWQPWFCWILVFWYDILGWLSLILMFLCYIVSALAHLTFIMFVTHGSFSEYPCVILIFCLSLMTYYLFLKCF